MNHADADDSDFFVVGVGASAGGVQALETFFANVPKQPNASFIVVQHLSPDFKSMMSEILQRRTSMTVHQIEDGISIAPRTVYVLPPGKNAVISNRKLHLLDRPGNFNYPIDLFFESLAREFAEHAIGVVLSGGGSDGTDGLQSISRTGGVALVQSPETAQFGSMPVSAISSGFVDKILSPKELAEAVYDIVQFVNRQTAEQGEDEAFVTQTQLHQIIDVLSEHEDVDFSDYKANTLRRRIRHRCALTRSNNVEDYLRLLQGYSEERKLLRQSLLIGATAFFRDTYPWQLVETEVLPQILATIADGQQLRIWVSACATGEEAYSLAMIVDEAIVKLNRQIQVKLFATDIDQQALAIAAKGRYAESIINTVSSERLNRYFTHQDGYFQVKQFLREMLIISPHDLTKNPGFSKMHLVTCRNVLIYMQPKLQEQVLRLLHFTLTTKGFLLLGSSENLGRYENEFDSIDAKWKLYRKKETGNRFLPNASPRSAFSIVPPSRQLQGKRRHNERLEKQFTSLLNHCFEEKLATCLLINQENEIERVFYDSANLLVLAPGEVKLQVAKFVPPAIKLPLETSINRVRREQKTVHYKDIRISKAEQNYTADLKVGQYEDGDTRYLIVIISLTSQVSQLHPEQTYEIDAEVTAQLLDLQSELQQTRENLQVTIEELETTNEEQQATNEELLASNEELQSTNEELQSVNEELYTVNVEHQTKIRELTQLNEDVDNLLRSTEIGVVFIDPDLNIRKFTSVVTEIINVFPVDIDRPLSHFTHTLKEVDIREFAQRVLVSETADEQEVYNQRNGDTLLMRGNPYLRGDGAHDGVVISFIKINEIKRIQAALEETNSLLENIYTSSPVGFALLDEDLHYLRINRTLAEINGCPAEEIIGKHISEVLSGDIGQLAQTLNQKVLNTGQPIRNRLIEGTLHPGEKSRYWTASYFPVALHSGRRGVAAAVTEITDLKEAEQALEDSQRFISRISESTPGIVYIYELPTHQIVYINPTVTALLGYAVDEIIEIDSLIDTIVHPDDRTELRHYATHLIATGDTPETLELRVLKKNGKWCWLEMRNVVFSRNEAGQVEQILGISTDISQRKRAERDLRKQKRALEDAISMAQAADSANQAKSEFLANMSHEIRTPMNLISGTGQLLERTNLDARQKNLVQVLRNNSEVLLTLIDDILDLSKLEAHELRIENHAFNLEHSLAVLAEPFKNQAEQNGLKFSVEIDQAVPTTISSDEFRIQQILRNLLSNAFKFTDTGQIRLCVEITDSLEELVAEETMQPTVLSPTALVFRVIDTGIGIETDVQPRLFEPFIQADTSTTRQYGGTGLGLTISRRIVELMQGQIGVNSVPSQGSAFWFKIPCTFVQESSVHRDLVEAEMPPSGVEQSPENQSRILIVEDNPDNRDLLVLMMEELGFTNVATVNDGRAFLDKMIEELVAGRSYDAIFMDCQMPHIDGYKATKQFRQNEPHDRHICIIGLTANAMQGDREKCLAAGMDDYLSKPVELDKLADILDKWL